MTSPHRDYAAEAAAETASQSLLEIAVAAEAFRLAVSRLGPSRFGSIALTHIDTAELFAESIVRKSAPPAGGGL